jgi:hypothetical protein
MDRRQRQSRWCDSVNDSAQNKRRLKRAPFFNSAMSVSYKATLLYLERLGASNVLDIGADDAEVVQLAIVESCKLTDCLLVLSELCKFLADVHFVSPSF